ncbi:MAG TPA: type II CAAX endopeptidase family protein [Symbiobacteriaceae bacterium]|nr:type II CAAX endopeptidase family protein [Symbiobacteriaceae bacterium]
MTAYTYKPLKFFALTLLISWVAFSLAAYFSYQPGQEPLQMIVTIAGSNVPFIVGLFMIYGSGNSALKQDYPRRLLRVNRAGLWGLPTALLLFPAALMLAVAISVLFGKSADQFKLVSELSLLIPILAPTFEELAWRGYGVDSLRSRYNLLQTSLLFSLVWGLWHVPMFFGNGYYQNELWQMGIPYVLNFFVSLVPFTIILNWLYYKTNRSILTAILFHIVAVVAPEAFGVEESTKFMQTGILLIVAAGIVVKDLAFFTADASPNPIDTRRAA